MSTISKIPVKLLGDLIAPRALERMLQEGAQSRGVTVDQLEVATLEDILKRDVFKRLQLSIPAPLAKKRVIEVLERLHNPLPEETSPDLERPILQLEEAARKFSLYFDWPETQRLRGILGIARQEEDAGSDIHKLVQEGQDLVESMERRLKEGLVAQYQDLSELKTDFQKVEGVSGREVRRLESLITQIEDSQDQQTLVPGEVERARNLVFKLRKKLESSMMQPAETGEPVPEGLNAEAHARVQALEQQHVQRRLTEIGRELEPLFRVKSDAEQRHQQLVQEAAQGQFTAEAVEDWHSELKRIKEDVLAEQREELRQLEQKIRDVYGDAEAIPSDARVALDMARFTLNGGNLANDELSNLRNVISAMSYAPKIATRILEQQRDLSELERSAREVKGAAEELMPRIHQAREELVRGREVDLSPLYTTLERFMGEAAQQREDFDARTDYVISEYDKIRSMRGDQAIELGRCVENFLREQRRLGPGPMSAAARERYANTLEKAEALLDDARAEFKAAQEVTSRFAEDEGAMIGLLDVFDTSFGGDMPAEAEASTTPTQATQQTQPQTQPQAQPQEAPPQQPQQQEEYTGFFSPHHQVETPQEPDFSDVASATNITGVTESSAQERAASTFDSLLAAPSAPASPTSAVDVAAPMVTEPEPAMSVVEVETWQMSKGKVVAGQVEPEAEQLAMMLTMAESLSLTRLDMGDQTHVWSARYAGKGDWRVARAIDWEVMDEEVGDWLDHGLA